MKKKALCYYDFADTTVYASRFDQRFSYCAYVPKSYREDDDTTYPLVVLVHGTERRFQQYRDSFMDFAEAHQAIILAPLFPAGIMKEGELDSYKFIRFNGIRSDEILLSMIEEMDEKYRIDAERFCLHGFSGGGHFAHRFYYLHPDRLRAVSIGAPGVITYLNENYRWHVGTADMEDLFGKKPDLCAMREVPVQMVVGDADVETWEINYQDDPAWMEGTDMYGKTRIARLSGLRDNFIDHGINVQFDLVPGVAHNGWEILPAVKAFFARQLKR